MQNITCCNVCCSHSNTDEGGVLRGWCEGVHTCVVSGGVDPNVIVEGASVVESLPHVPHVFKRLIRTAGDNHEIPLTGVRPI